MCINHQEERSTYLTGSGVLRIGGGVKDADDDDVVDDDAEMLLAVVAVDLLLC